MSPKAVPRMADSSDVFKLIDRTDGITYAALTPNLKGFEGAIQVQANEVAIFTAASEGKVGASCVREYFKSIFSIQHGKYPLLNRRFDSQI